VAFNIFGQQIFSLFSLSQLLPYSNLIVIALIVSSAFEIASSWATRDRNYKGIARASALQGLLGNGSKVVLGLIVASPVALISGHLVSLGAGISLLVKNAKADIFGSVKYARPSLLLKVAGRYRHFPIFRLPSQLLLAFSTQAPIIFFSANFNENLTGQLSMALTIVAIPLSLFGQSMSRAYYGEIANIGTSNPSRIREITLDVSGKLLLFSIVPALILFTFGRVLFEVFLGLQWSAGGEFASLLSLYLVSQFVTAPIVAVFNVFEKQAFYLVVNALRGVGAATIFLVIPAYFETSANYLVLIYSLFMTFFYLAIYVYVLLYLRALESEV
jgi:O-antigen/teichoic acid export membrane protein